MIYPFCHRWAASATRAVAALIFFAGWAWAEPAPAPPATGSESRLDAVLARGVVRVGTTGDFKPFTYRDPSTGGYRGFDIDAARALAEALGVEVEFVPTTWPNLITDLVAGRYDVAMGGITRTLERRKVAAFTLPYFEVGKVPLMRRRDAERFTTISALNRPEVKVGVNPGGTNEQFVRTFLPNATIIVEPDNLAIPAMVADGKVDVMITDNIEAVMAMRVLPGLAAVSPEQPFTHDDFAYLVPRDDPAWLGWLDLWVDQMRRHGTFAKLRQRWIGEAP